MRWDNLSFCHPRESGGPDLYFVFCILKRKRAWIPFFNGMTEEGVNLDSE